MAKLDGLESVLEFLKGLQPKVAAQIAKKVLSLNLEPLPADSKQKKNSESRKRLRLSKKVGQTSFVTS
jgi:mRNA interferase RelE/StbE